MNTPDLEAQRAAMKKLDFLIGKWSGEARALRGPGEPVAMTLTEEVYYKVGGLVLVIEAIGHNKADGKLGMQAFGIVSYDDETGTYHMRAFNDGRFWETEVKVLEEGKGMTWGFSLGPYRTGATMRIDDQGNWTEQHQITIGTDAPRWLMDMSVNKVR